MFTSKKFLIIWLVLVFLLLGSSGVFAKESCKTQTGGYCLELASVAQVTGLEFFGYKKGESIGQLMARIYIFGLSLVGIAALIMIVWGGVLYTLAGDNQSRLGAAKEYIKNALFGLAIALLSWLILNIINPDLVKNPGIFLKKITYEGVVPVEQIIGNPHKPVDLGKEGQTDLDRINKCLSVPGCEIISRDGNMLCDCTKGFTPGGS